MTKDSSCQELPELSQGYNGYWTYPTDFIHHKIVCLQDHEENLYYIGPNIIEEQKCKDLNEKYFDGTVDVSWSPCLHRFSNAVSI